MAYWADRDQLWASLTPTQKAAAMALLEADNSGGQPDMQSAANVLGAIVNRAQKEGAELGEHVSGKIYQPTIEDNQRARLPKLVNSPAFQQLTGLAESRVRGETPDWVKGATHFLAPEKTMLALERQEPDKYKNWGPRGANWTGYDPASGSYQGVVLRDKSHAFLVPGQTGVAPPTQMAATQEKQPMFDFLAGMQGGLGAGFGVGGKGLPTLASAADPTQALFGSLASFGGGKQGGGDAADGNLASQAASAAAGGDDETMTKMAPRPFDMQTLASMLQKSGMLGTGMSRPNQPRRLA
jgi:hypothetical protein